MRRGYNESLYLLPFDHRQSYVSELLHLDGPLTADQRNAIIDSKAVIYAGFRQALGDAVPVASAGILVDEEFGADILRDANRKGYVTALSTEKSGSAEFEFEYGEEFASHIAAFRPTFAKALVRYNPEGDAEVNRRQTARLKQFVLGHHAAQDQVVRWLETAASVPGFIGFAVGRTTFWHAIAAYVAKHVTRQEAVSLVARRYREWVTAFERARAPRVKTA
jgi:myo-inositol catabolism protein IolC